MNKDVYKPAFFRLNVIEEKQQYQLLLESNPSIQIFDEIEGQLRELIKSLNPSIRIKLDEYPELVKKHIGNQSLLEYGVWVYYPWNNHLIHLLDEEEFIEVRTNRNRYKITREEQQILRTKKIGIVGLSVGQSIALTLAMERTCGELRLADFDDAELSNLNRLRTGLHNLGTKKTIIAAREILEIDPFIKIKVFNEGLHEGNFDNFFTDDGKLDLLVEVCDGLDIKIESRFKARELGIPVVMDTNDRGMVDVERFDLEPNRDILHGLAGNLNPTTIKDLTNEEKIPYILEMIGSETISMRSKASMMEVQQSINTWPQLASSVVLGGAITTDVCRRIFLNQYTDSGRYYIDFDEIVGNKTKEDSNIYPADYYAPPELSEEEMFEIANNYFELNFGDELDAITVSEIIEAAIQAPSGGNAQPWKFLYKKKTLYIFHEIHFSHSLLDYNNFGSYIAIGASIENISIKASTLGYRIINNLFPLKNKKLVATVAFVADDKIIPLKTLESGIYLRYTNRTVNERQIFPDSVYDTLNKSISSYLDVKVDFITDDLLMKKLGEILATAEMLRIIHPRGHYDTFKNELRWTNEENLLKRDGLDVATLGATENEIAALKVATDKNAIAFLRKEGKGYAFKKMVSKSINSSAGLGIVTMKDQSPNSFLLAGQAIERLWIESNLLGISFQPITQLIFLLMRLNDVEVEDTFKRDFSVLNEKFYELFSNLNGRKPVFIFKLSKAQEAKTRSLRRPLTSCLTYISTENSYENSL